MYKVKSPGIGYDNNVWAIAGELRKIIQVSDVLRNAIAQIIWHKNSGLKSFGYISFSDEDIKYAQKNLQSDLQNIGI